MVPTPTLNTAIPYLVVLGGGLFLRKLVFLLIALWGPGPMEGKQRRRKVS